MPILAERSRTISLNARVPSCCPVYILPLGRHPYARTKPFDVMIEILDMDVDERSYTGRRTVGKERNLIIIYAYEVPQVTSRP